MTGVSGQWRLGHRPALDGLRGLAVALVLLDHSAVLPDPVGAFGVTVFFVLSGFLITRVIVEAREAGTWSYRRFLGNRAARLLPALVVVVVVTTAVTREYGQALAALLYVQDFAHFWYDGGLLDHTWSLAVEEQFYLLWPFLLPAVARMRPRGRRATSASRPTIRIGHTR